MIELNRIEPIKEQVRDIRMGMLLETALQDLKCAFRQMRRSPRFTASTVLTLAIGIGANATMLSVLNALVFKRLPVPNPDGLVSLTTVDERGRERYLPYAAVDAFLATGPFSALCGYNGGGVSTVEANSVPAMALYAFISGGCFETFGLAPFMGRPIVADDAHGRRRATQSRSSVTGSGLGCSAAIPQ